MTDNVLPLAERVLSLVGSLSYQAFNVRCPDSPWIPPLLAQASNMLQEQAKRIDTLETGIDALLTDFENEHEDHNENDLNNFFSDMKRSEIIERLRALLSKRDGDA